MIPIKLTLRNFLSYGETSEALDFTALHVACLTGCNGGGKSALLDGITWALWGKARLDSADDLVRLGQNSMQVEFDLDRKSTRLNSSHMSISYAVFCLKKKKKKKH